MGGNQVSSRRQGVALVLSGLLLVLSWVAVFGWINGLAILSLIPYDDVWLEFRPSSDTWHRKLNDFIERPPMRYVPACLAVGVSVALFLAHSRTFKTPRARIRLALGFTLSNFLLVYALYSHFWVQAFLPELPRSVYGGYGWTYRFILADTLLLGLWWALQAWGIPKWVSARAPREAVSQQR